MSYAEPIALDYGLPDATNLPLLETSNNDPLPYWRITISCSDNVQVPGEVRVYHSGTNTTTYTDSTLKESVENKLSDAFGNGDLAFSTADKQGTHYVSYVVTPLLATSVKNLLGH